jgi:hypothetical protein
VICNNQGTSNISNIPYLNEPRSIYHSWGLGCYPLWSPWLIGISILDITCNYEDQSGNPSSGESTVVCNITVSLEQWTGCILCDIYCTNTNWVACTNNTYTWHRNSRPRSYITYIPKLFTFQTIFTASSREVVHLGWRWRDL